MATLNLRSAPPVDDPARATDPVVRRTRSAGRHRPSAPHSRVAYAVGLAVVSVVAAVDVVAGGPAASATADPQEQSASVAVADALGIAGAGIDDPAMEDPRLLEQLATSRAQRGAEQAAAGASQAQAEQAAVAAQAEAAARAAADAAAVAAAAAAEADTATASASTVATAVAEISNSAGAVRPQARAAADAVVSNIPGVAGITIGGTRSSAADPGGHPSGLALDYMVLSNAALGDEIVAYHVAHWDELGVEYIIWQQRMLSSPSGSWTQMENRGSATANHMDHPHVNYLG